MTNAQNDAGRNRRTRQSSVTLRLFVPLTATVLLSAAFFSMSFTELYHIEHHNAVRHALSEFHLPIEATPTSSSTPAAIVESKEELARRLWPNETAVPNPPLADGNKTMSACLLVMDDNHRLAEWIAYHYHVLPLRHMIVAVDPRSGTSPEHIFNRWRGQGVHVTVWGDDDFWRKDRKLRPIADGAGLQVKRDRHRGRQKYFYKQCLIAAKRAGRTWVTLHDSDEFLVYNHAGGDRFEAWENSRQARHRASGKQRPRVRPSRTPPTTAQEGAMIEYIRQERAAGLKYYQSPCIGIPRTMFGANETDDEHELLRGVPDGFDVYRLDTMRYRKHAARNDFVKNALGKVMIDVSRVDVARSPYFMSLHRPIKSICPPPWNHDFESGLRINHYLGSWESYSFRDDSRRGGERSLEAYQWKAYTNGELTDDNIRPWLSGFVETHGEEKARELLSNAGLPSNYKNPDDEKWTLLPDKLEAIMSVNETVSQDNKLVAFEGWVREKYRNNPHLLRKQRQDVNTQ